jgi:hypothetical protein
MHYQVEWLKRQLESALGEEVEVPEPDPAIPKKAYVAVKDDTQPGGGTVYVLDVMFILDRELTRSGLMGQFGADHVWFEDELTEEQVRTLIGGLKTNPGPNS